MLKIVLGLILAIVGICLAAYLSLYVMLYGGIVSALDGWGVDNEQVAMGIIRAVLFSFGAIPGYLLILTGLAINK